MPVKSKKEEIIIRPVSTQNVRLDIVGDSPLIVHAWSEKAKKMILDKQMKKASKGVDAKNPDEDYINSMYWLTEKPSEYSMKAFEEALKNGARFGFPVTGIKQAVVSGAFRSGVAKDKVSLRGAFFLKGVGVVDSQMSEIISDPPVKREDMVRIGMGVADIRYRAEYNNWRIPLELTYNVNGMYSLEQIINMFNMGGFSVGIGEWRPEKDGQYGMFHVEVKE